MPLTERDWEVELGEALGHPVLVRFGRSRTSPIQLRGPRRAELAAHPEVRDGWVVRLHRVFAEAPEGIRTDLASWIRVGGRARRASRNLGEWTEAALAALPPKASPRRRLEPRGAVHDLEELRDELLPRHFEGDDFDLFNPVPPITWGRRGKSRTRGRLHLGSYSQRTGIVRLHPVLDQAGVPRWFVRYVLFHELLHAALGVSGAEGEEIRPHGSKFQARERAYPDYPRALEWEAANLSRLLRSARSGRPMRTR